MKFELKGAVNYLPAITYGKMKNSYAEVDFSYEVNIKNDIDIKLTDGVEFLTTGELYDEIVAKASFVKTGMEALNLDSKAGGDSLEDENRRSREVKDAPSTDIVRNAFNIEIRNKIGNDNGVLVKYGKNLKEWKIKHIAMQF